MALQPCSSMLTFFCSFSHFHWQKITNLDYDEHKGRIAIGRVHAGRVMKGMEVKVCTFQWFVPSGNADIEYV